VPNMNLVTSLSYNFAVNNVGVSPDGSMMAVVGDSNQVILHSISNANEYKRIGALTAVKDAAFSCAWDSSSTRFAVACQDGHVCIWDVRHLGRKLAQLNSFQRNQKGACRVVKFSQTNSVDLLAFSEHTTYFNIVDARTFDVQQSVRVAPAGLDMHLSGLTFSPDSDSIFVGVEQAVLEYSIDLMSRRSFPTGSLI
jgi:WD40 repeat protein